MNFFSAHLTRRKEGVTLKESQLHMVLKEESEELFNVVNAKDPFRLALLQILPRSIVCSRRKMDMSEGEHFLAGPRNHRFRSCR